MPWCWHKGEKAATLPVIKDGKILICGDKISSVCCGYWYECNGGWSFTYGDWQHIKPEDPCPPPPYEIDSWDIITVCATCPTSPPEIEIGLTAGPPDCRYSKTYEQNCRVTSLYGFLNGIPFDGSINWKIIGAGATFAGTAQVISGEVEMRVELNETQQADMQELGIHEITLEANMMFPDGIRRYFSRIRRVYCWSFAALTGYAGYVPAMLYAVPSIVPKRQQGGSNDIYASAEDPEIFNARFLKIRGAYNSQEEAQAVINTFYETLEEYARCNACGRCYECIAGKEIPYANPYALKIVRHYDGQESDYFVQSPMVYGVEYGESIIARPCEYFDVYIKMDEQDPWAYLDSNDGVICGGCENGTRNMTWTAWHDGGGFFFSSYASPVNVTSDCPEYEDLESELEGVPDNSAEYAEYLNNQQAFNKLIGEMPEGMA